MRTIVFDESLGLAPRACEVIRSLGLPVTLVRSLTQLGPAIGNSQPSDLIVAKLGGEGEGWEIAEAVRQARFAGRILAFVDSLSHPGTGHLSQLPRTSCVVHPPSQIQLDSLLRRVLAELPTATTTPIPAFHGIVGNSKDVQAIFARIDKVAASEASVCIYGESGTGKELVARAIHYHSARRDHPFVTLDCAAIPEGLVESQLFGHVKGAFTGAVDQRDGVFSLAHRGTLFIDELSELSLALQAKLLRVIQTREFVRVGGVKPIRSNIRLITAMNKDPRLGVEKGTFREDLYYRVAVVMVRMPPLRERREDIPLLVEHFLRRLSAAYGKPLKGVTPAALERMMVLPWPGNIRQLENFIEQAFVMTEGDVLTERDLFPDRSLSEVDFVDFKPGLALREVERRHILRTLQAVQGNRTKAAKSLRISVRTLHYKLKAYMNGADGALVRGAPHSPVQRKSTLRLGP